MRHLEITVSNVDELLEPEAYGAGALLRWESAALEAGPWTEGGTVPLLAGTTGYDVWDDAGVEATWYRSRISDALATTFSAYSHEAGPATQSVTSIADVRAMVSTTLSDEELQKIIDREEAWLEGRIGQLVGERTNVIYPVPNGPIWLTRRIDELVVAVSGDELDADQFVYTPSIGLLRAAPAAGGPDLYSSWPGPVALTYTPTDELEVEAAIIELVRLRVGVSESGGMAGETIGTYSYTRTAPADQASRKDIVKSILLPRTGHSSRIRSGMDTLYSTRRRA